MTRGTLIKLLLLMILVLIICLPEFFTIYRASKVSFLCLPYQPCDHENLCDPSQTTDNKKWEQACTQGNQSTSTDSASDSRRGGDSPKRTWFLCETNMHMAEFYSRVSSSGLTLHLEVSVELQLSDAETLNLTLYGRTNHTSLHLHPPEEDEEEEEEEERGDDEGPREAVYCCLPFLATSESANQSHCLLGLTNQTVLSATAAKEKLPWKRTLKDEWRCMFRVLWVALVCVLLLTIITTVVGQIYWEKRLARKSKVRTVGVDFTGQKLNEGEQQTEIISPKGPAPHSHGFQSWSGGLWPIQEADSQNDIETLLDGNADHRYTGKLTTGTITLLSCIFVFLSDNHNEKCF